VALEIRTVNGYADLQRWVATRNEAGPDVFTTEMTALVRATELEHVDLLAIEDGEPVGTAFLSGDPRSVESKCPYAEVNVPLNRRGRGIGSALLAALSVQAQRLGYEGLRCTADAGDAHSVSFLERRGFSETRRTHELLLELAAGGPPPSQPPNTIELTWLSEQPELLTGMYRVACSGAASRPDFNAGFVRTESEWRMYELGSPLVRLDLTAVATAGPEVVGYAIGQDVPERGLLYHRAVAVAPPWQEAGLVEALVAAQAAEARAGGIGGMLAVPWLDDLERMYEGLGYRRGTTWLELEGPLSS
jgi:GNAT superfamily N-acetyltransferase